MKCSHRQNSNPAFLLTALVALVLLATADTSWGVRNTKPPGAGGAKTPPNPAIVYLWTKDATDALTQSGVRGIEFGAEDSSTDVSLYKSKAGRWQGAIAWSPDGTQVAWLELGLGMVDTPSSIVIAAPGKKPAIAYTAAPGDGSPVPSIDTDSLAWGISCDGSTSVVAFSSLDPVGISIIRFDGGQPVGPPEVLLTVQTATGAVVLPGPLAFSPTGQHLVYAGSGPSDADYGVWLVPMCEADHTATLLITSTDIAGTEFAAVRSIDWSRHGDRLALSVTTGTDLPWRDLKIAQLVYDFDPQSGVEQVGYDGIWTVPFFEFPAASSEHSPQWGPSGAGESCQRLAFSQSSDQGRGMYLLDVKPYAVGGCPIDEPRLLNSTLPRALDWK